MAAMVCDLVNHVSLASLDLVDGVRRAEQHEFEIDGQVTCTQDPFLSRHPFHNLAPNSK